MPSLTRLLVRLLFFSFFFLINIQSLFFPFSDHLLPFVNFIEFEVNTIDELAIVATKDSQNEMIV